jgi:hypothetical protein
MAILNKNSTIPLIPTYLQNMKDFVSVYLNFTYYLHLIQPNIDNREFSIKELCNFSDQINKEITSKLKTINTPINGKTLNFSGWLKSINFISESNLNIQQLVSKFPEFNQIPLYSMVKKLVKVWNCYQNPIQQRGKLYSTVTAIISQLSSTKITDPIYESALSELLENSFFTFLQYFQSISLLFDSKKQSEFSLKEIFH